MKDYRHREDRQRSVFLTHKLNIARKTLELSDEGALILGGMTKEEAREILRKEEESCGKRKE